MDSTMESSYHPGDLSYYTTWWFTPTPSMSSQNTITFGTQNGLDEHQKNQVNLLFTANSNKIFHLENNSKSIEIYVLYSDRIFPIKIN